MKVVRYTCVDACIHWIRYACPYKCTQNTHTHTRARVCTYDIYTPVKPQQRPQQLHTTTPSLPPSLCHHHCVVPPFLRWCCHLPTARRQHRRGEVLQGSLEGLVVCVQNGLLFFFLHPGWTWHSFVVFSVYISCLLIPGGADCKTLTDDSNIYTFFILASLSVVTTRLAVKKREFMRRLRRRKRTETKVKRIKKEGEKAIGSDFPSVRTPPAVNGVCLQRPVISWSWRLIARFMRCVDGRDQPRRPWPKLTKSSTDSSRPFVDQLLFFWLLTLCCSEKNNDNIYPKKDNVYRSIWVYV